MIRNIVIGYLMLLCTGLAQTQGRFPEIKRNLELLKNNCGYSLSDAAQKKVVASNIDNVSNELFVLSFRVRLHKGRKSIEGIVSFSCSSKTTVAGQSSISQGDPDHRKTLPMGPRQSMREENSGGRYFRHVAWEQSVTAVNWTAKVAFSDYLFGDGQKSPTGYYLMCHAKIVEPCIEFEINSESDIASIFNKEVLHFLSQISNLRTQTSASSADRYPTLDIHGLKYISACAPKERKVLQESVKRIAGRSRDANGAWRLVETLLCAPDSKASRRYLTSVLPPKIRFEYSGTGQEDTSKLIRRDGKLIESLLSKGEAWSAIIISESTKIILSYDRNEACVSTRTLNFINKKWRIVEIGEGCD